MRSNNQVIQKRPKIGLLVGIAHLLLTTPMSHAEAGQTGEQSLGCDAITWSDYNSCQSNDTYPWSHLELGGTLRPCADQALSMLEVMTQLKREGEQLLDELHIPKNTHELSNLGTLIHLQFSGDWLPSDYNERMVFLKHHNKADFLDIMNIEMAYRAELNVIELTAVFRNPTLGCKDWRATQFSDPPPSTHQMVERFRDQLSGSTTWKFLEQLITRTQHAGVCFSTPVN